MNTATATGPLDPEGDRALGSGQRVRTGEADSLASIPSPTLVVTFAIMGIGQLPPAVGLVVFATQGPGIASGRIRAGRALGRKRSSVILDLRRIHGMPRLRTAAPHRG